MKKKEEDLYKWMALFVVVIGSFMAILDSSIVNIAIPKMMAVFGASLDGAKWIITSYMLTLASVIPLTGYLLDRFGTKKIYVFSLVVFTIGSLLCGLAWNNTSMIVFRVIQGLGGGLIMPVSMSIIYEIIPIEERGMALGFWGISAMAAPALGPTLGGYIIENLNWRLIFMINVPIGIIGGMLAWLLLKESKKTKENNFDYIGWITSTVGLVSILYVLGEGSSIDWEDIKNILLLIFGTFNLIVFIINELTIEDPLLDLRVLKVFPFTLSVLISSVMNIALYGGTYIMPLFLQNLRGYTPMQTGMLMFPSAAVTGIMMPISGKLSDRFGAKKIVLPGVCLLVFTTYELSKITMDTSASSIMVLLALRGLALGLAMMPSSNVGMNAVPPDLVPRASALSNTIRQVAGSLSITILTTMLQKFQDISYYRLAEQVTPFNNFSMDFLKGLQGMLMENGLSTVEAQGNAQGLLIGILQKQAFISAVNDTLLFTVFSAIATIPLVILIREHKKAI